MIRTAIILLGVCWAGNASAAECKAIQDPTARLACFDKPAGGTAAKKNVSAGDPELEKARRAILATKARLFNDADSLKDASIGKPFTCLTGTGTCVCIEVNGKTPAGGYSGLQIIGVRVVSSTETDMIGRMARTDVCGMFSPFPQLNGKR